MSGFVPKDESISLRIPSSTLKLLKARACDRNVTVSFLLLSIIRVELAKKKWTMCRQKCHTKWLNMNAKLPTHFP